MNECFTQHQTLAASSSWALYFAALGLTNGILADTTICWIRIWSYTLAIRTDLASYRSDGRKDIHPCSWARTNGYGLITGFGDGLLNLAKVNVCALTVGSRQQDGWPRLGLVRIILYGKMFTHLPKQLQSLHNRGRHWRKTLMVLERQHYPEEHKAFLGTKFYYL